MNTIDEISEKIGLTKTNMSCVASFVVACCFWKTKYKNIYLTDYNIHWQQGMNILKADLLKSENLVCLFYSYKGVFKEELISGIFLEDIDYMKRIIDNFHNEILKIN